MISRLSDIVCAAVVASLTVLLLGGLVLGFNFAEWNETGGRSNGHFRHNCRNCRSLRGPEDRPKGAANLIGRLQMPRLAEELHRISG